MFGGWLIRMRFSASVRTESSPDRPSVTLPPGQSDRNVLITTLRSSILVNTSTCLTVWELNGTSQN